MNTVICLVNSSGPHVRYEMISDNSRSSGDNLDEDGSATYCLSFVVMDFASAAHAEGQRCTKLCKRSNQGEKMGKRQTGQNTYQNPVLNLFVTSKSSGNAHQNDLSLAFNNNNTGWGKKRNIWELKVKY